MISGYEAGLRPVRVRQRRPRITKRAQLARMKALGVEMHVQPLSWSEYFLERWYHRHGRRSAFPGAGAEASASWRAARTDAAAERLFARNSVPSAVILQHRHFWRTAGRQGAVEAIIPVSWAGHFADRVINRGLADVLKPGDAL